MSAISSESYRRDRLDTGFVEALRNASKSRSVHLFFPVRAHMHISSIAERTRIGPPLRAQLLFSRAIVFNGIQSSQVQLYVACIDDRTAAVAILRSCQERSRQQRLPGTILSSRDFQVFG